MAACEDAYRGADSGVFFQKDPIMKWLAISLGLLIVLASSGCWRPYYGRRSGQGPFAQPAYGQPAVVQPTYSQPVVQQGVPVVTQAPVVQAAPVATYQPVQTYQQCVPCQPCCVPCY
jgi:hypothetical protein